MILQYQIDKPVFKSNLLPVEVSYKACDINTREEVNIYSGELIEGFEIDGKIYLSPHRYDQLKNDTPVPNR